MEKIELGIKVGGCDVYVKPFAVNEKAVLAFTVEGGTKVNDALFVSASGIKRMLKEEIRNVRVRYLMLDTAGKDAQEGKELARRADMLKRTQSMVADVKDVILGL